MSVILFFKNVAWWQDVRLERMSQLCGQKGQSCWLSASEVAEEETLILQLGVY